MKELSLIMYEIKRLLHVKKTWLFIVVFMMVPVMLSMNIFGLGNNNYGTMANVYFLSPATQSALIGVFAALFLTILEMQRITKYRMSVIIETATNPLGNQLRQTIAIIIVAFISIFAALCILLPYTMITMGSTFKIFPFLACWIFIYFGAILITLLFASGFFMISRSFIISFIIVSILIALCFFSSYNNNFLLFWVSTKVFQLSDATESFLQIDIILYTRLVWLIASSAVYVIGLTCIRRYGKNLLQSMLWSCRKVVFPILTISLVIMGCYLIYNQPFFDNGPILKTTRAVDPQTGIVIYKTDDSSFSVDNSRNYIVSVLNSKVDMTVDTDKRFIKGTATYLVQNPSGKKQDVMFSILPGLNFLVVYENDKKIEFKKNRLDNFMSSAYHLKLTADKNATLRIVYKGSPKSDKALQIRQWGITDKFVLIPNNHPMPSCNWNYQTDCTLNLPKKLTPIIQNTKLKEITPKVTGDKTYEYKDLGYWLIAGEYDIEKIKAGGHEIQFIYQKGREQVMKDSKASAVVADVVNFFTKKFGPLDFNGMPFIIAELDGSFVSGGWGLGNMSVFGEASFVGAAYKGIPEAANMEGGSGIGVTVHEIAHQWWGWSPDSVYVTEDGKSPWSSEGLTVYSTYLYMKERYGEKYAKREFVDKWVKDTKKMQNAFYLTHLQYAGKLPEKDAADIYTSFASTTRYDVMPYLLLKAEKHVGGEDALVNLLKKISQKYRRQELTYEAFLQELGLKKEDMQID